MLNNNERTQIENQILSGMLVYENFFLQIYDFYPQPKDLFHNVCNKTIYETTVEYYVEKGYPSNPEIYTQLILNKSSEKVKEHFIKNIHTAEPTNNFNSVLFLIEDSIEVDVKQALNRLDKRNITGLEYAQAVREESDKVILAGFEQYRTDNRDNEQKVHDLLNSIQSLKEGKTEGDYLKTGFQKIDDAVIGLPRGHLTILAARPGVGKSSFMMQLKRNLVEGGHRPLIISIEMSSDQLLIKDISAYAEVNSRMIESGKLSDFELEKLHHAANNVSEENYWIEDSGVWSIEKIKSTIRKYLVKKQIDCVFIDYLQIAQIDKRRDRYDLAVGEVTSALREFAKETGLPVVLLSQLNREVEKRSDKRPQLSDLRESGSIEADAKLVLFLYRPSNYGIDPFATTGRTIGEGENKERVSNDYITQNNEPLKAEEYLEVIVGKARNGKIGICPLRYIPKYHKFENVSYESESSLSTVQYNTQKANWSERETGGDPI